MRQTAIVLALAAAIVGYLAVPASASAATLCGFGYTSAYSEPVVAQGDPLPAGTIYLLHNATTNTYCGITIKSRWAGIGTDAWLSLVGNGPEANSSGIKYYYAGPVYTQPWADGCLAFGTRITSPAGVEYWHQSVNPAIGYGHYCKP
jgi:hypothetical protein